MFSLVVVLVITRSRPATKPRPPPDEEAPHAAVVEQQLPLEEEDLFIRIMCRTWPQLLVATTIAVLLVAGRLFAVSPLEEVDEGDISFFFLVLGGMCALSGVRYIAQLFGGIATTGFFIGSAMMWPQDTFEDTLETIVTSLLSACAIRQNINSAP